MFTATSQHSESAAAFVSCLTKKLRGRLSAAKNRYHRGIPSIAHCTLLRSLLLHNGTLHSTYLILL